MGAVSPVGLSARTTWESLLAGHVGVTRITDYDTSKLPTKVVAMVKGFDPERYLSRREARRTGRVTQLAIASTEEAIADAGLDLEGEDLTRVGVEMGSAFGALSILEDQVVVRESRGLKATKPTLAPAVLISTTPSIIAIRHGIHGPVNSPVAACATGVFSLGSAARRIQNGKADVMLAGGTDAYTSQIIIFSFSKLGAMTKRNDEPETAIRPFDLERDGMTVGEGAVTMVLESLEHAQARGATILAEYGGMGFTSDAFHLAAPDPEGIGAGRAIKMALEESGLEPEDVDYIAAHGTATRLNDPSETKAIKYALGEHAYNVPVSSIKPMIAHAMGAAGAFGALTIVEAIRSGWVPPTLNYSVPDPECDLDYVPNEARQVHVDAGMTNAFGFGGQNASMLIKRFVP
jgi:3-oxoacyl-[acyl-carrier-protein] synthase II